MSDNRDGEKSGGSEEAHKDDRMQELRAEIARLEERSEVIRKDRAKNELKFQRALLRGVPQVPREPIKSLKHPVAVQRDEHNVTSASSSDTDVETSLSPVSVEQSTPGKRQIGGVKKDQKIVGNRKKNKK